MIAGLLYGYNLHYLDHVGPICSLLKIPLIVDDQKIFKLAKKLYPNLKVFYVITQDVGKYFLQNFKVIISCLTKAFLNLIFFPYEQEFKKNITPIWCPHGNSDKGLNTSYFNPLASENYLLVYGKKMLDILREKKIVNHNIKVIEVGNYRKEYCDLNFEAYQSITKQFLNISSDTETKYLYAPTWSQKNESSHLLKSINYIVTKLKKNERLFIKLHPNTIEKDDFQLNVELLQIEKNPQISFITDFSPIYPILYNIDAYIGDFSSIGYDVLALKKPLGFLLPSGAKIIDNPLFKCGINLSNRCIFEDIFSKKVNFVQEIEYLNNYTFSKNLNWKDEILKICK